jgi:hypothetical protein
MAAGFEACCKTFSADCKSAQAGNLRYLRTKTPLADGERYTTQMARGWESKSVEDQIGAAEAERDARGRSDTTPVERERNDRQKSLLLSRALILQRMAAATNPRYLAQLENTLAQLEAQLSEVE